LSGRIGQCAGEERGPLGLPKQRGNVLDASSFRQPDCVLAAIVRPKFGDEGDVGLTAQSPWALGRRRYTPSRDSFDIGSPVPVSARPRNRLRADSLPADVGIQRREVDAKYLRGGFGRNIEVILHIYICTNAIKIDEHP
jgi:hypothetical protein